MQEIFITFEGGEGAGKTTQIQLLRDHLLDCGLNVIAVRDPGGTAVAEQIRQMVKSNANADIYVRTEALLYLAARCEMVNKLIRPHLSAGRIVLCDRFADSTIAYQGFANELDLEDLEQIGNFATGNLTPTLTFYLKIDPKEGLGRKTAQQDLDRVENKGLGYHKKVQAGFEYLAAKNPRRIVTIDATLGVDEIHQIIIRHTNKIMEV
ncbi:MAG: dTMP kinase [Defluviitaleaceae bacterium]|nr:dTMP kinase [Defluviitaleaceae bacterium]